MKRIDRLRETALNNTIVLDEFYYKFYKHYANNPIEPESKRYANAFYNALATLTPLISEGELIVGKCNQPLSSEEEQEWQSKYRALAQEKAEYEGPHDSHMSIDYELILSRGIKGIIQQIDGYLSHCTEKQAEFYQACKRCLEAVIQYSHNYAAAATNQAGQTADAARRAELETIAEICRRVPENPAETFYEALQSVHFVTHCLLLNPLQMYPLQFQLGHPDRYLLPYYQKDIQSGAITKEYAQLLLDCLGIQINMRVPSGLSSGYMVGGRDETGNIVANELTDMCMQVIDDVKLVYPAVGLCYTEGMDDHYLEKACEILSHGRSHPAIFNDDVITKGLKSYGVPEKEAHNYIHSTCVEITPVASSNVWVASPYINIVQILLDVLDREYPSFDALLSSFFGALDQQIEKAFIRENNARKIRAERSMNPLLSCFVNDCLARGTDIDQGGARYNWIMPSFVGVANLVDSLYALKEMVFEKKEICMKEFNAILADNFDGHEIFRLRLLNGIAKYGNDNDDIDQLVGMVIEHIVAKCKQYRGMHQNGNVIPSVFCWEMHERFGRETGATPDGRTAGFPLGDGSGPCQGRELNGPTASILSSTKWAHDKMIGGVAVNMKFSKKSLGTESVNTMKNLIKTYLQRGGFELQINIVDKETLQKATKTPEAYQDLVVRIGGYSDYFVRLSNEMQQEVILRTEHQI